MKPSDFCPCDSHLPYSECCQNWHQGKPAPSALALMRSRYSAYVLGEVEYIIATTVPAQQHLLNREAIDGWSKNTHWKGLKILRVMPKIGTHHAQVEFQAEFEEKGQHYQHHELSGFVFIQQQWFFIDPTVALPSAKQTCFCDSGKKFKHCCAKVA